MLFSRGLGVLTDSGRVQLQAAVNNTGLSNLDFVAMVYRLALGREASDAERTAQAAALAAGGTRAQFVQAVLATPEYMATVDKAMAAPVVSAQPEPTIAPAASSSPSWMPQQLADVPTPVLIGAAIGAYLIFFRK